MTSASNLPIYAQKTIALSGVVSAAMSNPTADIPTGLVLLGTVDTGGLLTRLWAMPRSTTSAGNLLLYRKASGATHYQLIDSLDIAAVTSSPTTKRPYLEFTRYTVKNPLECVAGDQFYVGVETAQSGGIDVNIAGRGL